MIPLERRQAEGLPAEFVYSEMWYWLDRMSRVELVRTHHYLDANGDEASPLDPKNMILDGLHYRRHKGNSEASRVLRDPAVRFPHGSIRRAAYVLFRRIKCFVLGR